MYMYYSSDSESNIQVLFPGPPRDGQPHSNVQPRRVVSHMRMRTCLRFKVHLIGRALRSKVRVSRSAHNVVPIERAQRHCMKSKVRVSRSVLHITSFSFRYHFPAVVQERVGVARIYVMLLCKSSSSEAHS